ncbi:MAG: hypothetical protein ICV60_22750 [Pyrinomonadaceae bacterium]|nr:hypothetical protein [Pyrinomonadaceae bacterium]
MSEVRDLSADEQSVVKHDTTFSRIARRIGIYLAIALVIFLAGFIPMWLKGRANADQRDAAQRELRLSQMQNALGAAAIDARRGEYETARQTVSDFFTTLSAQVDGGNESALTAQQREGLRPLLAQRDEIITLLARSDPASADRLSDMYVAYRKAMTSAQPQSANK